MTKYFTKFELGLWASSVAAIVISYAVLRGGDPLSFIATLIGVTSLIFCAKGNPIGQVLMILFSVLYSVISFAFAYYGEMLTYAGMTLPMSVFSLVSWLKNPYKGRRSEVAVNRLKWREIPLIAGLAAVVTAAFYFILRYFGTANLIPSTLSVTTSFVAVYLTFRRSPFYAIAYAANDAVLIILWTMAVVQDISYASVLVCFVVFLVNDIYGFISWRRMEKRQAPR